MGNITSSDTALRIRCRPRSFLGQGLITVGSITFDFSIATEHRIKAMFVVSEVLMNTCGSHIVSRFTIIEGLFVAMHFHKIHRAL